MKKDRTMESRVCSLGNETSDKQNQERKLKMNTNVKNSLIGAGLRGIAVTVAALFAATASAGNRKDGGKARRRAAGANGSSLKTIAASLAVASLFAVGAAHAVPATAVSHAVDGRIISAADIGDSSDWIEVAHNNGYSLIVRQAALPSSNGEFGSSSMYGTSAARNKVNNWFKNTLGQNAPVRNYTVKHNALSSLGSYPSPSAGLSTPTETGATTGDDVAFLLSFGEAASFISGQYIASGKYSPSSATAKANANKLVLAQNQYWWLRTPNASDRASTVGNEGGNASSVSSYARISTMPVIRPALWVSATMFLPTAYTVRLDHNIPGASAYQDVPVKVGSPMPSATAPTRAGHTFEGFFDSGDVKYYNANMSSAKNWDKYQNDTLYAKWAALPGVTVTFDYDGATSGNAEQSRTVIIGQPYGALPAPEKTGYTFGGWFVNGAGAEILASTAIAIPSNHTLVAKWTTGTVFVLFEYNGATGGNDEAFRFVTFGQPYGELPVPTKADHIFGGWFHLGTSDKVEASTLVANAAPHELEAQWTQAGPVLVQFDYVGATGGTNEMFRLVAFGQPYGALPVPIKAGHFFDGWRLSGLPDEITGETLVDIAAPHELIAQWTETVPIFVYFEYNGATGGADEEFRFVTFHAPYGELPEPTKPGHTFGGWFHLGTSDKVEVDTLVTLTDPHMLEARWDVKSVTVTFDYDGATEGNDEETRTVLIGEAYGALPEPVKPGHTFAGWHIHGYRAEVFDDTLVEIEEDHTLVAAWETLALDEQFLHVRTINVDRAAGIVTLRWDPAQIEGELVSYEIHATGDLATPAAGWDIYAHDGVTVVIDDSGAAEHTALLKPALLANPLGDKGFFKVKALTRQ